MTPSMTPEQRDLQLAHEKIDRLEREAWERDKRLLRAEQRISSLAAGLLWTSVLGIGGAVSYLVFHRRNDFWDWLGIITLGLLAVAVVREAVKNFEKERE